MKNFFTIIGIVFCVCVTILLWACRGYKGYSGEYPELYSVAINTLVGSNGFSTHYGEAFYDPTITVLEEDDYGRILFYYYENNQISTHSLLICQKSDKNNAFYYPDYNFISAQENHFSNDKITELKEKNSWNKEVDEGKCVKVEITRKKIRPKISKSMLKDLDALCQKVATENGCKGEESTVFRGAILLTSDDYGRRLYYVWGIHRDVKGEGISPNSQVMDLNLVIIFNPDGTYDETTCVMELVDFNNYQNDLRVFKELNDWNQPLEQS